MGDGQHLGDMQNHITQKEAGCNGDKPQYTIWLKPTKDNLLEIDVGRYECHDKAMHAAHKLVINGEPSHEGDTEFHEVYKVVLRHNTGNELFCSPFSKYLRERTWVIKQADTGQVLGEAHSSNQAAEIVFSFELQDKMNGIYIPNSYEIFVI
jgi:hypothetical protein